MRIQCLYAALTARDMARAEQFYTKIFGRGPDDRPMDGLIQWRNVAGANVQIFRDEKSAGHGRCTIVVPRMSEARQALSAAGIVIRDEERGDFGKIAQLDDPDGNLITLAEPPSAELSRTKVDMAHASTKAALRPQEPSVAAKSMAFAPSPG